MPLTLRFAFPAFAGMLLWTGGFSLAGPAWANEAVGALASPAARLVEANLCRVVVPTFEPVSRFRARLRSVKFPGGARLHFLVAVPCRPAAQPFDL
jgi:hypothetical protein